MLHSCMQVLELPTHPYYIGVQFHPEFKSRPGKPSALFLGNRSTVPRNEKTRLIKSKITLR